MAFWSKEPALTQHLSLKWKNKLAVKKDVD